MARLGVTYQDIANAADQILGQGRQPTIELIRNLLGTGSTTTIANHLRKWRVEQDGSTSVAIKENLPQEFVSMMKGLWQRVLAHADGQVVTAKEEAEQSVTHLQQEVEKYKTNNQRWQKLHDTWVKEKNELSQEKTSFEHDITSLQKEQASLTAKFDAQCEQLSEKQQRIDELHRLHKLAQENLEHFRESTRVQRLVEQEKYAQQLQQFELSFKTIEQQLVIVKQDKITLQKHSDKIFYENETLQKLYNAINNKFDKLQSDFIKLQKEQSDAKHDAAHWHRQHEASQKKCDGETAVLVEQQKQNAIMAQRLSMACDEIKELKEKNKLLMQEKWEIAQEKSQLEGVNKQMQRMTNSLIEPRQHK